MRYFHNKTLGYRSNFRHGQIYKCGHPLYSTCTLYLIGKKGLAVIQQRYNQRTKSTIWTSIDSDLVDDIFCNTKFREFFDKYAAEPDADGLYPTVPIRPLMWYLRMKPLAAHFWESKFIHEDYLYGKFSPIEEES